MQLRTPLPKLLTAAALLLAMPATLPCQGEGVAKPPAAAEQQDPAKELQERIDKAIKDYEEAKKDPAKQPQRRRMLGWLGEIDDPRVTEYLVKELRASVRESVGTYALEALGKVARPDIEKELVKFVRSGATHQSVRAAAVAVVCGFGDEACDRMIELADDEKNATVRGGVLQGLSRVDSDRARKALVRMMTAGDHAARLYMLQNTASIRGDERVDQARRQCVKEGNLIVAATSWRILAEQGSELAPQLTLDVIERVFDTPDALSAAELVRGLAIVADEDFYPALLRFGAVRGPGVKRALELSAKHVAKNDALIEFLIEEGLEAEAPAERTAARLLLREAPAASLAPLVEKMRKQLRRNRKKVLDDAAGLHDLLAKDPTWVQDLAELADANDLESRMLGLALLLEMGSPAAVPAAQSALRNRSWELRSLAFRYLTKNRDVTSIPLLIDRYGKEDGRLNHELEAALFVHTGTRCWSRSDWSRWWRENSEGFVLPHPNSVKGGGSTKGGQTISYYDIPLVSSRIAFLVDHSGSMKARVGTDQKRTRLDAAKEQLRMVIGALPKTHQVNLILFESNVTSVWREIRKLSSSNRKELLEEVDKIPYAGGTNIYGGLVTAYEDPDVDTVYLLTDGDPSAGKIVDAGEIVEAVQRLNRTRQIVIHCISVGKDSELLKDLAALTGGEYKRVN